MQFTPRHYAKRKVGYISTNQPQPDTRKRCVVSTKIRQLYHRKKPDTLSTAGWASLRARLDGTETQGNERNGNLSASQTHIRHRLVNSRTRKCATKSALTYYTELHVGLQFGVHEFIFRPVDRLSRLRLSRFPSVIQENSGVALPPQTTTAPFHGICTFFKQ